MRETDEVAYSYSELFLALWHNLVETRSICRTYKPSEPEKKGRSNDYQSQQQKRNNRSALAQPAKTVDILSSLFKLLSNIGFVRLFTSAKRSSNNLANNTAQHLSNPHNCAPTRSTYAANASPKTSLFVAGMYDKTHLNHQASPACTASQKRISSRTTLLKASLSAGPAAQHLSVV